MKKADTMLTFLFYLILALVIFIPTTLYGAQFLGIHNEAKISFSTLANMIQDVGDGEIVSSGIFMDSKSLIVGFSKDANKFENHEYDERDNSNPDLIVAVFDRPKGCGDKKACICHCKNVDLNPKSSFLIGETYTLSCDNSECKSFDNIDFLPEKVASQEGAKKRYIWKGGFLHLREIPARANGLIYNELGTRTFYVQRYKNTVDVCLSSPCITDEIKNKIEKSSPIT